MLLWILRCMYLFKLAFSFSLDIHWGLELLDHTVVLFLVFWKPSYCFPQWLHKFTFRLTAYKGSLFSTSPPIFIICGLFDDSHSDCCEVIPHCDFDLHFSWWLATLSIFTWTSWPSVCHLWKKCLFRSSVQFLIRLLFFDSELYELFRYVWILTPCQSFHLQMFSPIQ